MLAELIEKLQEVARENLLLHTDPDSQVVLAPDGIERKFETPHGYSINMGDIDSFVACVLTKVEGPVDVFVGSGEVCADMLPNKNLVRAVHMNLSDHSQFMALNSIKSATPQALCLELNTSLKGCFDEALAVAVSSVKVRKETAVQVSMTGGGKAGRTWRIQCGEDNETPLPADLDYRGRIFNEWPKEYRIECALAVSEDGLFSIVPKLLSDVISEVRKDIVLHLNEAFDGHSIAVYVGA